MEFLDPAFWSDHLFVGFAIISAVVVVISALADKRRQNRKRIEDVGFMPWTTITVFAVLLTVIFTAFAIKVG